MLEDEILEEIEKNSGSNNDIVMEGVSEDTLYDGVKVESNEKPKKEKKVKKESKWSKFSKKKKIIIISIIVFLILLISGVLLYIFVFKKDNALEEKPNVIVEKDNYRYENGTLVLLERDKEIGTYECKNKDVELCFVAHYSNEDNFDLPKSEYLDGTDIKETSDIIFNRYVFINDTSKKEEENVIAYDFVTKKEMGTYKLVKKINDYTVILKNEADKYGVMTYENNSESEKLKFEYDYLGAINSTSFAAIQNNKSFVISYYEKSTKEYDGVIKNFNTFNKYVSILKDGKYYLYNKDGEKVVNEDIDFVNFSDRVVYVIKNNKIYLYDADMMALTYDGYSFEGTNYNTVTKYDKNLKWVETKEYIDINVYNGDPNKLRVGVTLNDKEQVILDYFTGKLNSQFYGINYFDGKLYIYKEPKKINLLATYKCNNKNTVSDDIFEFDKCDIAQEKRLVDRGAREVGYVPIYNERFAFIQDGDKIYLWDFQKDEKKATYKSVDVGGIVSFEPSYLINTLNTQVVCLNTNGSYGVIAITKNDVEGVIPFKNGDLTNTSIKFLYDNYLIKRSDDTYHLYDHFGKEVTNPDTLIKYEIVDYTGDYIKVVNGSKNYLMYGLDGKIASNEYKYISIKKDDFVAINDKNEINVFKLNDGFKGLIKETVKITNTNYEESYIYKEDSIIVDGKTYKWSK
ncbi:MAG: hypothetical protein RR478_01665 [Bacilli bacterium]